jgi:inorganic pyrophosphatase
MESIGPHRSRFWQGLDKLVDGHEIAIDWPRGSTHPRYPNVTYPLDYGYLEGTCAADGGGIDVWLGSLPVRRATGIVLTVDLLKRDAEMKILLGCTPEDMEFLLRFHSVLQAALLVEREE